MLSGTSGTTSKGAAAPTLNVSAEAKAACPHLTLYTFQANLPAQQFYAREGFTEIARSDGAENDEHLPDLRLLWRKELQ